jgi:hypothetical protein
MNGWGSAPVGGRKTQQQRWRGFRCPHLDKHRRNGCFHLASILNPKIGREFHVVSMNVNLQIEIEHYSFHF